MRHCNSVELGAGGGKFITRFQKYAALARIDKMNFQAPVYIGEVAELQAQVTYTSKRSMEVTVRVSAENLQSTFPALFLS